MRLSDNAKKVLEARYLKPGEVPESLFYRVARNIALVELLYHPDFYSVEGGVILDNPVLAALGLKAESLQFSQYDFEMLRKLYARLARQNRMRVHLKEIIELLKEKKYCDWINDLTIEYYRMMADLEFLPNTPTLMNAGTALQQLSACFVLPVEDDLESIFESVKQAALIHKSGGGTGFNFSRLRPKDDQVLTTGGVASGPISFMRVFDASTNEIKQGGKRRGANMGLLRVDHPDILDFIQCKQKDGELSNFNISVGITDDFMDCLEHEAPFELFNPRTQEVADVIDARIIWDAIVENAWRNGEPGVIFLDAINCANTVPDLGQIEGVNPCGEQPLRAYESCNLGSINLSKFVVQSGDKLGVDWDRLKDITRLAVQFLDAVIDANKYPLREIERETLLSRKIGLGVMGWAEMLCKLGIPYDSEEALELAEAVMKFINRTAKVQSISLAEVKGAFPGFDRLDVKPIRNATLITIAPTGSLSIIADTSGGIEPYFSLVSTKVIMDGEQITEVNKVLQERLDQEGIEIDLKDSIQDVDAPSRIKRVFKTALEIDPEYHVRMQSAFQKYTDNAVSKTINLPYTATKEDVERAIKLAYHLGCKGITVYRDGSRINQVQISGVDHTKSDHVETTVLGDGVKPRPRPDVLNGTTEKVATPLGSMFVTLNTLPDGEPFEAFLQIGKAGSDVAAFTEAIARLISLTLRCGVPLEEVVSQLRGIGGNSSAGFGPNKVLSVPDAIGKFLQKYLVANERVEAGIHDLCPGCGQSTLVYTEGCYKCEACGYSGC